MGSSSKGLSSSVTAGEQANSNALVGIAQGQAANANQLFQMAFPGMQQSENFAQTLSTGDPYAIAKATAPATQQISQATAGAKQNIMNNAPAGGEKNLALEQADVQQGSQVGSVASQGYLNSFNTLAQLGGAGVGLSNSASSGATSAYGASSQTLGNLGNQQVRAKRSFTRSARLAGWSGCLRRHRIPPVRLLDCRRTLRRLGRPAYNRCSAVDIHRVHQETYRQDRLRAVYAIWRAHGTGHPPSSRASASLSMAVQPCLG